MIESCSINADVFQYRRRNTAVWFNCTKQTYAIFKESEEYDVRTLLVLEEIIR